MKHAKVLIAGGGTGGHIFPGIAIADELKERGCEILFVGTKLGQEQYLIPKAGYDLKFITTDSLKGRSVFTRLRTLLKIPLALYQSFRIIKTFKPGLVLGIGGYASGPIVLVASILGYKTSITDQNAMPGFTNRLLCRFVRKVYTSFESAKNHFPKSAQKKIILTGNPVRKHLKATPLPSESALFRFFVFGGSRGAEFINSKIPELFLKLKQTGLKDFGVTHQTGKNDEQKVRSFYAKNGIKADVHAFIDDMQSEYTRSHLVISRSGAMSVSELCQVGRATLFIPYPHATDDHQFYNALDCRDNGGAFVFRQESFHDDEFLKILVKLMNDYQALGRMSESMLKLAKPDACKILVDDFLQGESL